MRFLLVLFVMLSWTNHVLALPVQKASAIVQQQKKPLPLKLDSSKIEIRRLNDQAIKEYSAQKEFIYDDVVPKGLSWWDRFWRWIWYIIDRIFGGKSNSASGFSNLLFLFLKWFLVALLIAAISYLLIKIFGLDLRLLVGKSKTIEVPYEESLENIHEINFDDQLEAALKNDNYRLAVRLLYLSTLKKLSDQQLINWQLEKTNQAYVAEITDEAYQQEFSKLTTQFEYIWYGEFFIDKAAFETINQSFSQFNQQMK